MSSLFWLSYALLWVIAVGAAALVFVLMREIGRIYLSQSSSFVRDGIAKGRELPDVKVGTAEEATSLRELLGRHPYTMVLAVRPDCPYCPAASEAVLDWAAGTDGLGVAVLVEGEDLGRYREIKDASVARLDTGMLQSALRVRATPFAFLADRQATVMAKGVVNDSGHIERLLEQVDGDLPPGLVSRSDGREELPLVLMGGDGGRGDLAGDRGREEQ
jgi:hypothetical protein